MKIEIDIYIFEKKISFFNLTDYIFELFNIFIIIYQKNIQIKLKSNI